MTAIDFSTRVNDTRRDIDNAARLTEEQKDALRLRLADALYDYDHARNPYSKRVARSKAIKLCARLSERAEDGYKRYNG